MHDGPRHRHAHPIYHNYGDLLSGTQNFKDFTDLYRTSKTFILKIVRSSISIAYYLLILENIFTKYSANF